jgi:hypothetical protein
VQLTATLNAINNLLNEAVADFENHRNINILCERVRDTLFTIVEAFLVRKIEKVLHDPAVLRQLKVGAAKKGLGFNGYRSTSIRLLTGNPVNLQSPYFAKAKSKRRPAAGSSTRKNGTGCHFGLDYLGFISRCSALLGSVVVQAALLCPSFELARRTLKSHAIDLNVKTIHRLTMELAAKALPQRGRVSLTTADRVGGKTVLVCIDGGRLRERRTKQGPKPEGRKRQGFHADWKEPVQFVIQIVDEDGKICRKSPPLYDATLGGLDSAFELLETYLRELEITTADRVVFCCDGARSYWKRIKPLAKKLAIPVFHEVIDHTHAKQNLYGIIDKLPILTPAAEKKRITEHWLNLLWDGKFDDLGNDIEKQVTSPKRRREALAKLESYFNKNQSRMTYAEFRRLKIPIGSGCVESAIRRVINLRLKSPGTFWKLETAESMLFLRNQLLSGRWNVMMNNVLSHTRSLCCN